MPRGKERASTPPTSSTVEVITLGECLVGLVALAPAPLAETVLFERHVAGSEANVAVGLSRLGHSVSMIGRVGDDGFGTAIIRRLRGEGVEVAGITVDREARTGLMIRERRGLGPAEVLYYRSGSAGSRLSAEDVAACADRFVGARQLHITGITPALSSSARGAVDRAVEIARSCGLTISLDLNIRRKLWSASEAGAVLSDLVARADIVMGSLDEAAVVVGAAAAAVGVGASGDADQAARASSVAPSPWPNARELHPVEVGRALLGLGAKVVVLKLGTAGSVEIRDGVAEVAHPGFAVPNVADPVGAGDAFAAGYLAGIMEGLDPIRCLELGNAAGASVVAALGDMTALPTRLEIERLIESEGDSIR